MSHSQAPLARGDEALSHGFGRRAQAEERWPLPLSTAFILALSGAAWLLIVQGGRALSTLFG